MRTRSGLLYAGKKTDYWVALNPASGDKHSSVTTAGIETCTAVAQVCINFKNGELLGKVRDWFWEVTEILLAILFIKFFRQSQIW